MRQSGGRVAGVFRKKSVGASKETRRSGFLMLIYGSGYVALRRRIQPSAPSAEPNSQTAAGTGTRLKDMVTV